MDYLPEELQTQLRQSGRFKESSLRTIVGSVKRVIRVFRGKDAPFELDLFRSEFDAIKEYVENLDKMSAQKNICNHLCTVLSMTDLDCSKYRELFDHYRNKAKEYRETPEKVFIPLQELNQKREQLSDKLDYLIASCYTYLPPLRGQDYYNSQMVRIALYGDNYLDNFDHYGNYLDLSRAVLVIAESKTNHRGRAKIIQIPSELLTVLQEWADLKSLGHAPQKLLDLSQSEFSLRLKKIMGAGVDHLRSIYISEMRYYLEQNLTDLDQQIYWKSVMAYIMGHSVSTQREEYCQYRDQYSDVSFMKTVFDRLKSQKMISNLPEKEREMPKLQLKLKPNYRFDWLSYRRRYCQFQIIERAIATLILRRNALRIRQSIRRYRSLIIFQRKIRTFLHHGPWSKEGVEPEIKEAIKKACLKVAGKETFSPQWLINNRTEVEQWIEKQENPDDLIYYFNLVLGETVFKRRSGLSELIDQFKRIKREYYEQKRDLRDYLSAYCLLYLYFVTNVNEITVVKNGESSPNSYYIQLETGLLHCKEGTLRLPQELLDLLSKWSYPTLYVKTRKKEKPPNLNDVKSLCLQLYGLKPNQIRDLLESFKGLNAQEKIKTIDKLVQ